MSTYAVIWSDENARSFIGKLELGATSLTLDGTDGTSSPVVRTVRYVDIELRSSDERLAGHRAVAVGDRRGARILIASLDRPGTGLEFADEIAAHRARSQAPRTTAAQ
ncbi:MAG: hypothetical protein ABI990_11480 [Actinomycetota bacterium]